MRLELLRTIWFRILFFETALQFSSSKQVRPMESFFQMDSNRQFSVASVHATLHSSKDFTMFETGRRGDAFSGGNLSRRKGNGRATDKGSARQGIRCAKLQGKELRGLQNHSKSASPALSEQNRCG